MRGGKRERIEKAVELGASAVLAVAVGFSLFELLQANIAQPYLAIGTAWSGAAAFLVAFRFLRALGANGPDFQVRPFELPGFSFDDLEELLLTEQVELILTDADRVKPRRSAEEELVLNDILAKLEPDSRVVRLFDPSAMPTPAQLNDRIERHLRVSAPRADPADASDALYQALNELRRSLR
jgi:hypothetical protein